MVGGTDWEVGVEAGSLKILAGVLVHRATRPLRGSVSCGTMVVAGRYLVCRFNRDLWLCVLPRINVNVMCMDLCRFN